MKLAQRGTSKSLSQSGFKDGYQKTNSRQQSEITLASLQQSSNSDWISDLSWKLIG